MDKKEVLEKKLNLRLICWVIAEFFNIFLIGAGSFLYDIIKIILMVWLVVIFVVYIYKLKGLVSTKVIVIYSLWMILGFCIFYLKDIIQFIVQYL